LGYAIHGLEYEEKINEEGKAGLLFIASALHHLIAFVKAHEKK